LISLPTAIARRRGGVADKEQRPLRSKEAAEKSGRFGDFGMWACVTIATFAMTLWAARR
jgi:hypothetical protein